VFVAGLDATEEMAKKEKATCISCHRTAKGGRPGNSMLSPRGFNYLRGLIQSEGYVPLYNYQELQLLNAKIAENKRIQEGGAPLVPTPEATPIEAPKTEDPPKIEEAPGAEDPPKTEDIPKPAPTPVSVTPTRVVDPKPVPELKPSQMAVTQPATRTTTQTTTRAKAPVKVLDTALVPAPNPVVPKQEVLSVVETDGTVILPRAKPIPYYNWREDWEYDDYF